MPGLAVSVAIEGKTKKETAPTLKKGKGTRAFLPTKRSVFAQKRTQSSSCKEKTTEKGGKEGKTLKGKGKEVKTPKGKGTGRLQAFFGIVQVHSVADIILQGKREGNQGRVGTCPAYRPPRDCGMPHISLRWECV